MLGYSVHVVPFDPGNRLESMPFHTRPVMNLPGVNCEIVTELQAVIQWRVKRYDGSQNLTMVSLKGTLVTSTRVLVLDLKQNKTFL